MRFTLDTHSTANLVTGTGPEGIRIGNEWLARSFIVSAADLVRDWPVIDVQALSIEALDPALRLAPDVLVLGTGDRIRFPASSLYAQLAAHGIGLEVMDTAAACRTYNVLVNEDRPVVAALILP
jgi:uncharacterized protein